MLFLSRPAHRFRTHASIIALASLVWAASDLPLSGTDTSTATGQLLNEGVDLVAAPAQYTSRTKSYLI